MTASCILRRSFMTLILEESLVLEEIVVKGYERVVKVTDKKSGLVGIICIHNTSLGPALGGIRIYPYSTFDAALNDAMRLAKGMTYKSALARPASAAARASSLQALRKKLLNFSMHSVKRSINWKGFISVRKTSDVLQKI